MNTEMTATQTARLAMAAMAKADPVYWSQTLQSRLDTNESSWAVFTEISQEADLVSALSWAYWGEYSNPALGPESVGFMTRNLGGKVGVVTLRSLEPGTLVKLVDPKGVGKVSAEVCGNLGETVDFTVLICGQEPIADGSLEMELRSFTVHPGHPVNASRVNAGPELVGKILRKEEAILLGLEMAKVVRTFD